MSEAAIVEAREVAIGWEPDERLLENVNFTVAPGEIFGILGRSASGKTTLMRALIGLDAPLAGELRIVGVDPVAAQRPPRFGVMFQQGALFGSLTVAENVALPLETWTSLPRDAISAVARAKLRLVGLEGAADLPPSRLSGGMRKRAAIARALALEPPLLFLDEPSSGLDPITSAEIDHLVVVLARAIGLTVVLVTHELTSIRTIVDRCILLDREARGVLAAGAPNELADSPEPRVHQFFSPTETTR